MKAQEKRNERIEVSSHNIQQDQMGWIGCGRGIAL
jgi:hypothetical protein